MIGVGGDANDVTPDRDLSADEAWAIAGTRVVVGTRLVAGTRGGATVVVGNTGGVSVVGARIVHGEGAA